MIITTRFTDRREAGRLLADLLQAYANRADVMVLALPRGGVPVAYQIAHTLRVPLDVLIVRKIGVGAWFESFDQVSDQEVRDLLRQADQEKPVPTAVC